MSVTGRRLLVAGVALTLSACVMVPRTTYRYDAACRVVARQMTLQPVQIGTIAGCANQACATLVAAAAIAGIASTIVSGSIVVVGNAVYWFERQGQCQAPPPLTAPAPTTTSPAPAPFPPADAAASPPG